MSENKDSAIKLFGATIPLKPTGDPPPLMPPCGGCSGEEEEKDVISGAASESHDSQEKSDPPKSLSTSEFSEVPSDGKEDEASIDKQASEEQQDEEPSNLKGKALKKPDKVLPCPRCNSMDTKFCYYNNYNVNQPRHFCKNCQRYWTAGGTMRNVPVGSGRRKNKNSNPFYRLMARPPPPPPPHAVRADVPDVIAYPLNPHGTVLRFGSDTPVSEPMAPALNHAEENTKSGNRNGFQQMEEKMVPPPPPLPPEHTSSSGNEKAAAHAPLAAPCLSGSPLLYPPWIPAPLCGPSFPVPFYPAAAFWNCTVAPVTWSTPLTSSLNSSPQGTGSCPSPLGKHTREDEVLVDDNTPKEEASNQRDNHERRAAGIWIPKTLRIHDSEEAAKSSIWSLIGGARNSKADVVSGGGLFKGFQPDEDTVKSHARNTSAILHANPAALSRSLSFQESSS